MHPLPLLQVSLFLRHNTLCLWNSDHKMYFKISLLFNIHIKHQITRTVLLPVRLRNMKINVMKLFFQITFLKTMRKYFHMYSRVMETSCLQHCPTRLWLLRLPQVLGSQQHTTNATKRVPPGKVEVCAGEQTVFQALEHNSIDQV